MNLIAKLSDSDLLIKTKSLVTEEKRITQEVLNHLEEIEYRKLYLARGYPSLFTYCVEELGYSESSAHRRISTMRVIKKIPQAKEKLESGSVNLSTLTQLHGFLKKDEKAKIYTEEMKLDLLEKISGKSQEQCEKELVKLLPLQTSFAEKEKILTEDLTQMTFIANGDLKSKLETIKNLTAHKKTSPTLAELVELMADMVIETLNPVKNKKDKESATSAAEVKTASNTSRYIPANVRRYVWKRDQSCCQYTDQETKKKCESKYALQIDHVHPFSLGGTNEKENLRLLCRAHNSWRTKELYKH